MTKRIRKIKGEKSLTLQRVREALAYDLRTGVFTWRINRAGAKIGDVAGGKTNGYAMIRLDDCAVYGHRLAWFYVYGAWPDGQIDHINGNRSDNSWDNLRSASQSENSCNGVLRSTNTSGYRGVSWSKEKKKWVSRIVKDKKQYVIGYFSDKEEAYYAYLTAARELHGEFRRS